MKTTLTTVSASDQESEVIKNQFSESSGFRIDRDYGIGLGCLALSAGLLAFVNGKTVTSIVQDSFLFNYLIALFYLVWLLAKGKLKMLWKKQPDEYRPHRLLLGYIWLASCFALNHALPIFNESASWLSIAIVISACVGICFAWEKVLPSFLRNALFLLMSASTILWCYYALYLSWLYPASLLALVLFGFSAHSFIPLLLSITHIRTLYNQRHLHRSAIIVGAITPLLFLTYFCVKWNTVNNIITYQTNDIATRESDALPDWVVLGQTIGTDWISKKVVMADLVYQITGSNFSFLPTSTNMGELSQHDPLVYIASLFTPKTSLAKAERIKLLDVLFDSRHYTQERLWSGSDLVTSNVITQAKIYPEFRLAYTEKTISIQSRAASAWQQEEALYTFHLPDGSVISSLSLWIDGVEQKSRLTTQAKADSAYKTIVGVESRDPSVVHWQEGNTVKVKVFPCTNKENRKFKIGITSPLKFENNQLAYENIWFQGPPSDNASEIIKLGFSGAVKELRLPFKANKRGLNVTFNGKYQSDWEARFNAVAVSDDGFNFNGKSYYAMPFNSIPESFSPNAVYLDINKSWTKAEFDGIFDQIKNKPVYVFDQKFERLSQTNKDEVFENMSELNYSLFPVHEVTDRSNALLITKSNAISPNLKDLTGSNFSKQLNNDIEETPLKTLNFGQDLSPYLKTLQELRIIRSEEASFQEIKKMISLNQFPADAEADKSMLRISRSKQVILQAADSVKQNAPDHLFRLFAYNHIMKQMGHSYLNQRFQNDSILNLALIREAEQAHIVTPISSMIVLETQKDYDRFDIKKSKNSLDNATLKSSGAVPEPHEWALIVLFALLVGYYTFRNYVRG